MQGHEPDGGAESDEQARQRVQELESALQSSEEEVAGLSGELQMLQTK